MREEHLFNNVNPEQSVWSLLQQVPGLSEPTILKICSLFGIKRKTKINVLNNTVVKRLEKFVSKNFLVGYKLIRQMSATVTARFISRSRRGIRSRNGLPINGQRTHSNGKTPRRLRGHWVLPEVLKDPGAYYITQHNQKRVSNTLSSLLHATIKKPALPANAKRRTSLRKIKKQITQVKPRHYFPKKK